MTIAAECKCGNVGGYCNGGEGCFFKPVSEISKEIRAFSAEQIQQRIADLQSENTALKLEVEKYREALLSIQHKASYQRIVHSDRILEDIWEILEQTLKEK